MTVTCQIKHFLDLDTQDLYEILQLRSEIFVVEQQCIYQDMDGLDQEAVHFLHRNERELVAYLRVLPPGVSYNEQSSIGRVVVRQKYRKMAFGRLIMKESIQYCLDQFSENDIKISAQQYLDQFYQSLGFENTENYYLEDGIPHQSMIFRIKKS